MKSFPIRFGSLAKLFLGIGLLGCGGMDKNSNNNSSRPAGGEMIYLEDMLQVKRTKPNEIIQWLTECSLKCASPDREIAKELSDGYRMLFAIAEKNPDPRSLTSAQKRDFLRGQDSIRQAFVKVLQTKTGRDILEVAYHELSSPNSFYGYSDLELEQVMTATIQRLKGQKETLSTAYYMQGISQIQTVENLPMIIESFQNCLSVTDYKDLDCRQGYLDAVKFYERPRCKVGNFKPSLEFREAISKKQKKFSKPFQLKDHRFFIKTEALLTGKDLLEASLEMIGDRFVEISFSLKTTAVKRLYDYTVQKKSDNNNLFVVIVNKEPISHTVIQGKIPDGQFRLSFQDEEKAKLVFGQMCLTTTSEQVPQNLKIQAALLNR